MNRNHTPSNLVKYNKQLFTVLHRVGITEDLFKSLFVFPGFYQKEPAGRSRIEF